MLEGCVEVRDEHLPAWIVWYPRDKGVLTRQRDVGKSTHVCSTKIGGHWKVVGYGRVGMVGQDYRESRKLLLYALK